MANEYNIQMNQFNGTDYDNLYPVTFTPTTGQLFGGATSDDEIFSQIGTTLQGINQVGTIQPSVRTDLDNTWLLCNGDSFSSSEYPELTQLMSNFVPKSEWKIATLPFTFNEMIFDGTYYVGVGQQVSSSQYSGVLAYSTSLEGPWTTITVFSPVYYSGNLNSIMYDGTYYITGGARYYNGTYYAIVAYSTSLTGSWTIKNIYSGAKGASISHVDYINGQYILSGSKNDGTPDTPNSDISCILSYSTNITGTFSNVEIVNTGNSPSSINNIVYGNGYYMCPGITYSNSTGYFYATSLNGPWTRVSKYTRGTSGSTNKAIFVNGNFIYPGGGGVLWYGSDPTSMTSITLPGLISSTSPQVYSVIDYYNLYICSIDSTGTFGIAYNTELNPDTSTWETNDLKSVIGAGSIYNSNFGNFLSVNNYIILIGRYQTSYAGAYNNCIIYNNIRLPILTSNECYYYIKAKEGA